MLILSRRRRSLERLPEPTVQEVRAFMDAIRAESIAELHYDGPVPAVDVQAEVDSWEYDKTYRPWEYARRLADVELGGRAALAMQAGAA
ncbi:hypothetical protein ACGFIV_00775 [Sphaerisporangium sp. NPDC049003]|uniref:hypothetical protein n=1 Tax=Sphaerisporangium sp. NPDC049003 TaxID=3364517 RepID=UPI003716A365